jgi:hypothetical protein
MKKGLVVILLVSILLISPLVQAQEQTQTYSAFNRFVDNVRMFFSFGDAKVILALEMRENEIGLAIENSQNQKERNAIQNLERAHKKLQLVQEKVSLDTADEVEESVDEIIDMIEDEEDLSDNFDVYVLEERKTQLTAELIKELFEMCKKLASEDFALMLEEEACNPGTAPGPLRDDLEELRDLQLRMFVELMLEIRSCIDDPGTCNCEANVEVEQKAKCEKMVALAMRCEYKEDETSCNELKAMEPKRGDSFAESFVPDFLRNLFREKEYMIEYDIGPSDCVPEECWDYNDKPECRQYDSFKETKEDWDEYGNFIGTENKCGTKDGVLTMRESIPQCFDENDNFLEEKCGEITMVENEDGLINYLIGKEIDNVIDKFENVTKDVIDEPENTIDVNGSQQTMVVNGTLGQTKVRDIKGQIDKIDNNIKDWVVDHPGMDVDSDDGLNWDIKIDVVGDNGGDVGVIVAGDGGDDDGDGADVVVAGNGDSGDSGGNNVVDNTVDKGSDDSSVVDED